jgi:hypothetical protein
VVSPDSTPSPQSASFARHRYGVVLGLTILAVLFSILAPDTQLGRAIGVLLQGATLLAVIVTAREDEWSRDSRGFAAAAIGAAVIGLAVLVELKVVASWVASTAAATAVLTVLVILTRGIVRLIRERGVTVQAVAGALTTYLLIGLEFALMVRVIVGISNHQYFAQVTNGAVTQSQEIYFSFTTLTTTGYGDLSPILSAGRALSVLEMLIGQIYLVTVIGLLVGNLRRSPERAPEA